MTSLAGAAELDRFRSAIEQRIGLRFDDGKRDFLSGVLQRRLKERGWVSDAYLAELEFQPTEAEIIALAQELTVGETYFFRNNDQFRALAEVVVPERIKSRQQTKTLRFLSAGCSSGEEAYSAAIVLRETLAAPMWTVSIRGVDINPVALQKAKRARFSNWALRETPDEIRAKWFHTDGRDIVLDGTIRAMVSFEHANIANDAGLWPLTAYDVIFCRNVLMYFEPEQMRMAVNRIARSLAPGGYLFLGHAETLRGLSERFRLCSSHDTFYYQLKDDADRDDDDRVVMPCVSARPPPVADTAWFDAIRLASERVAALLPEPATATHPPARPHFDPAPALDLFRQERFAEALNDVRARSKIAGGDRSDLLFEAVLLTHCGELAAAEEAASRILRADRSNAGAHYILALCQEHAGFHSRAGEHHRAAACFEPSFAMPRLHLGLLARRAGDHEAARREFAHALLLLKRESDSQLLLFGGGFSREALINLCQFALEGTAQRQ